jgi:hypothetical protein
MTPLCHRTFKRQPSGNEVLVNAAFPARLTTAGTMAAEGMCLDGH